MRRLHSDQSGAVALLALVGILITLMTALILFDAGFAVRHKFKAQISADTAAYSQAAIKARVMNDIAYVNVVKRTMLGVWGMYVGMMYQFYREAVGTVLCAMGVTQIAEFMDFFSSGDRTGRTLRLLRENRAAVDSVCRDRVEQYEVFHAEAYGDWRRFSNDTVHGEIARDEGAFTNRFLSYSAQYYRENVRRLETMQQLLVDTTPKWAMVEGMVRGRASGADKIDAFMTPLPTRQGVATQMCLLGMGHLDRSIATGPELVAEITANRDAHARRSDRASRFKPDYDAANLSGGLQNMGVHGCASLLRNFDGPEDPAMMAPWVPTQREAQDYVNTGRDTPLEEYRRKHFLFLRRADDLGHPEVQEYEGVSCGEIVDLAPEYRGFRASWAPRIAPVGKCDPARAGWWK